MAVHSGVLRLSTAGHGAIVDLTEGVRSVVDAAAAEHATVTVFVRGSTAAVTTMEHEPGGVADLRATLERLVPALRDYEHNVRNGDSNGHAHLRASLVGPSVSIPVVSRSLVLGTWQQVVLLDFDDRPRDREIVVQVVS
jgi:secondary thiamine-phosphate synthase enzyme